jgi:anti-sigma28 factor (negative regulator of flagellin synthesis)
MRKAQILKAKIESGEYQIQTGAIASVIVNPEKPKQ